MLTYRMLYDRQPDEPEDAWSAFQRYRDLPNPRPSLESYAGTLGYGGTRVRAWATRHDWASRILSWDQEVDGVRQGVVLRGTEEMAQRHIRLAKKCTDAAEKALDKIITDLTQYDVRMKPHEISRLVEVGSKLERLSRGEATERIDGEGQDYSKLSDADLSALEEIASKIH